MIDGNFLLSGATVVTEELSAQLQLMQLTEPLKSFKIVTGLTLKPNLRMISTFGKLSVMWPGYLKDVLSYL